jgi:hypothetical protein
VGGPSESLVAATAEPTLSDDGALSGAGQIVACAITLDQHLGPWRDCQLERLGVGPMAK